MPSIASDRAEWIENSIDDSSTDILGSLIILQGLASRTVVVVVICTGLGNACVGVLAEVHRP